MARFGPVVTAMVTPFDDDGALDLDGARVLARHLVANGSDALVVAGTTGEGPVLGDDERIDLFSAVAEAVTVPMIASTGTNDTAHSVAMTRAAEEVGAAAVLVVTPYYNRPSVAGLRAHFSAVADATGLPVMLYDIPVRSGRRIGCDLTLELARSHGNILAIKDATGDVASAGRMVAEAPDGFEVYCGDDSLFLPFLAVGAEGLVGVATHWAGSRIGEMARAFGEGRVGDARRMNASLDASWRFESSDDYPNPVPTKAMMRVLGLPGGSCRLPHGPITAEIEDRARAVFAGLDAPASKNAIG